MNIVRRASSEGASANSRAVSGFVRIGGAVLAAVMWYGAATVSSVNVVWAADGSVAIVSPKANATVGSDVTVTWIQEKGGRADHVHVFVDGGQMKPVKTGTSTVMKGLSKGTHEITVQAYSSEHEPLDARASVTVKVE